jgi:hypothetical protein
MDGPYQSGAPYVATLHGCVQGLTNKYRILSSMVCHFYIENDTEIFPEHYTWKVAEKGFKMAFIMNKQTCND